MMPHMASTLADRLDATYRAAAPPATALVGEAAAPIVSLQQAPVTSPPDGSGR